ncbi:TPA: TIGR03759 family integrating conjugative element protein, partial [Escherichia coli]|nr:TIGR03759 family integrating conjugative element protein [Escherichia coli]
MIKRKILYLLALCPVLAQSAGQTNMSSEAQRTTGTVVTQSITSGLQQQAGQWGVSEEDYRRYQSLMSGPRGIQSPGLDPLTVLGIEARTPAERRVWAEKWVRAEYERTEKELAFQQEVNAAWKRLYPGMLPVSMGKTGALTGDTGGRLALFVK